MLSAFRTDVTGTSSETSICRCGRVMLAGGSCVNTENQNGGIVTVTILAILHPRASVHQKMHFRRYSSSRPLETRWRRSPWYETEEARRDWCKNRFSIIWRLGATQHAGHLGEASFWSGVAGRRSRALEMRHSSAEGCCRGKMNPPNGLAAFALNRSEIAMLSRGNMENLDAE